MFLFLFTKQISTFLQVKTDASVVVEQEELRQVCCDSLVLLSSAAPQVAPLLRPLLLQCLVQTEFCPIVGLLARCLNSIAARSALQDSSESCPELRPPASLDVLARCLVVLGSPLPDCGTHVLKFLQISAALNPTVQDVLDDIVPQMINQLQGILP